MARFGWCGDGQGVAETLERQEEVWEIVAGRHGQIKARLIRTERRPRCTDGGDGPNRKAGSITTVGQGENLSAVVRAEDVAPELGRATSLGIERADLEQRETRIL